MPLRVTDANGIDYSSTISQGLIYAADHGARAANASFRGLSSNLTVRNAAQYMKDKEGLVFVAAGNTSALESFDITASMIPVSATDIYDEIASFSSYGDYVALAAPGNNFYSTRLGGDYMPVAGTSFASPVAAGVAALMVSINPQLSNIDIENLLFSTTLDLGTPGCDPYYGYGRVDAAAAVEAAKSALPAQDTEAPAISIIDPLGGAILSGLVPVDVEADDNVGVTRAELWVNNTSVVVDSSPPPSHLAGTLLAYQTVQPIS